MPLVQHYRAARILKAKRSKRLKGRPEWQDQVPDSKQGRDAYKIAAKYESTFARAFLAAVRNLITPDIERDFRKAWKTGSPSAIINSIPYFEEDPDAKIWKDFTDRLSVAYATVIQAAGDAATRDLNKQFGIRLKFTTLPPDAPPPDELIEKSMDDVRRAAAGMTVAVNPYSIKWIKTRGLELVTQSVTLQQKKVVTGIITQAMEVGVRPTEAIGSIKANIGLLERDYLATLKRKQLHLDAGLSKAKAEALTGKYREKLLTNRAKMIARTETISAQAQGRKDAWLVARDAGELPAVQRSWMAAPPSPNPQSPCEICLDLDDKKAPLDEPYDSIEGPVDGPPAHPQCLPGDARVLAPGVAATSERRYHGDLIVVTTALGNQLSCTPNHLILGSHGWVAAKDLKLGDNVVRSCATDWISPFIDRDHDDRPATIHEKAEALRQTCDVTPVPMPTTAEDFHGDGMDGEVAIVWADSQLIDGLKTARHKQLLEGALEGGVNAADLLFCSCPSTALQKSGLPPTRCRVCGLGVPPMFIGSPSRHHQSIRVARSANGCVPEIQESTDFRSADSEGFCNRVLGLAGKVRLDNVVNVDVHRFSGHVFNLQTEFSWYISQGLISHNCRCTESLERV